MPWNACWIKCLLRLNAFGQTRHQKWFSTNWEPLIFVNHNYMGNTSRYTEKCTQLGCCQLKYESYSVFSHFASTSELHRITDGEKYRQWCAMLTLHSTHQQDKHSNSYPNQKKNPWHKCSPWFSKRTDYATTLRNSSWRLIESRAFLLHKNGKIMFMMAVQWTEMQVNLESKCLTFL